MWTDRGDGGRKMIARVKVGVSGPRQVVGKSATITSRSRMEFFLNELIGRTSKKILGSVEA